jgi:inositol 1,4,5-triphosphate receptor type 1/inositol 1,4,5-triphosphate receptor type 3
MTFSSLRKEKDVKLFDTENICFICGLEKNLFDKKSDTGEGFKIHVKYEHHMWNYLYFFIYLWEQDKDDDDGLEWFVRYYHNFLKFTGTFLINIIMQQTSNR